MKIKYKNYIFWFSLVLNQFIIGQNIELSEALLYMNEGRYQKSIMSFHSINIEQMTKEDKALWSFYLGHVYNLNDQQDLAFEHMVNSKELYKKLNRIDDVKDCNIQLLNILSHQNKLKNESELIIDELTEYISKNGKGKPEVSFKIFRQLGSNYLGANLPEKAMAEFRKSYQLSTKVGNSRQISLDLMNIGTAYKHLKKYDSSLIYTKRGLQGLLRENDSLNISYNYNNQAEAYKFLKIYDRAEDYYYKAEAIVPNENKIKSKMLFYDNIANLYEITENYKSAYNFTICKIALEDSINEAKQNLAIEDFRTKYKTVEKDKQRLRNQNIAIALGGSLLTVSLIAFLLFKNTKKKQRIAEQEKELEIQKTEKILKEQELTTIDAMIEGQEKERQRLASDLHDSVGATLSAARLQFDHISKNKGQLGKLDELIEKTGSLLDDAYNEVRSMAHLKNSGVIAKNGLLPAVEKLAKNASGTNQLKVEVQDFGLEDRLENSLEITIFRIIQELVTNVIKHADASEATISITQHKDSLNIIVEDNGRGFDAQKFQQKEGMGLSSIERRIEHLEGTLEVDSTLGKGTSVLIDIPL